MFATKPCRYVVEYESSEAYERLKKRAIARGEYTEDCDDWFDPAQIHVQDDAGNTLSDARAKARRILKSGEPHYGQVRVVERTGIEPCGDFWDYDGCKEVETVE
jgi:hypothetical protein